MLPFVHRLRLETDIKTLFARGKSVFGLLVGMKMAKNEVGVTRFAVVVGTKISKRAVVRNRLRRQLRGILLKHLTEFKPGFDVILMPKKEAIGKTSKVLEQDLLTTITRKTRLL
ncbi:MAG: ribonuclease P protein component [Patescibacteria group bacterium]